MLRIEVKTPIDGTYDLKQLAAHQHRISENDIEQMHIVRRSLDARIGREPKYLYILDLEVRHEKKYAAHLKKDARIVEPFVYHSPDPGEQPLERRPVVVGFGPAGMAAALLLARKGYRPIVIERGPAIEERQNSVNSYWHGNTLDPEKNIQFGEGGAGAFSDGKLTTRVKDPRVPMILDELVKAGADPSIVWINHPHIGTEKLCEIDIRIRKTIESLGGEVRFNTRLDDIRLNKDHVESIITDTKEEIPCSILILATGHSARDTFRMLGTKEPLLLQPKNFAVGVRVEHLQSFIDAQQYKSIQDYTSLPPAEYHLSHTSSLGKGCYSFCMCPGGYVVASASNPDTIVTNGMSYAKRDGTNANSALIVQVDQKDFGPGLYDGMNFQDRLEKKAWVLGKQKAPAEMIRHYLHKGDNNIGSITPTYSIGVTMTDMHELFSDPINQSLTEMLEHTESIFPGFSYGDGIMTGVETRTSSPIRIVRDFTTMESGIKGMYPCGEGAGYAGGIVSSAIDGIKAAEAVIARYHPVYD
ncbi:MAG: hypothetical protein VZT48_00255 [Bulleidia sp.]|nr:hypothetical protein [Bulleidia sp.]